MASTGSARPWSSWRPEARRPPKGLDARAPSPAWYPLPVGWLAWDTAALIAAGTAVPVVATRSATPRWVRSARGAGQELILVLGLYSVWRFVKSLTVREVHGAIRHAETVWHVQRWMHLPSEVTLQRWFLDHPLWVQAANIYYAAAHVPATIALLVWLFVKRRDVYGVVRTSLAISTAVALVLHIVPVAPPRLLPHLGFADSALLYHQSVYGETGGSLSDIYGALPSIHAQWAVLVAIGTWVAASGRWRWLGPAHLVLTTLAVTATANHWWLDTILGVVVVGVVWLAVLRRPRRSPPERVIGERGGDDPAGDDDGSHRRRDPSGVHWIDQVVLDEPALVGRRHEVLLHDGEGAIESEDVDGCHPDDGGNVEPEDAWPPQGSDPTADQEGDEGSVRPRRQVRQHHVHDS